VTGRVIAILLCLVAVVLAVPVASPFGGATWLSLTASSAGFVAMAINQYLATRPRYLEPLFGGLDRMYHFHRHIGMAALALILIHYFFTPNFPGLQLNQPINNAAKLAGEYGFYGLVALIAFSLVKRIPFTKLEVPYHLWRQSHRLIGILFVVIAFHQSFIKKPIDGNAMLFTYLNFFAAVGVLSFAYTQFVAFFKRRRYQVTAVERLPAATVIEAKPVGWTVKAKPGQFAFLSFAKPGLREPHPFTIAGLGPDGTIRFAIKPLGDYTKRLREAAAEGDRILVEGGYGRFTHVRGGERQLWLAGGIGITPFLAMADSLKPDEKRKISLVHCVRDSSEAVRAEALSAKAGEVPGFTFHLHDSAAAGRMDAARLAEVVPFDINGADLWFCGPPPLRQAIVDGLTKAGRRLKRVEFERFEFR